jgi:hypothetical protein
MPVDKRIGTKIPKFTDPNSVKGQRRDPGPYIGIVKDNADSVRAGRLRVFIPDFGGIESEESHWIIVSFASPYLGALRQPKVKNVGPTDNDFNKVNHSYGMWFTPPDIGNFVLVTFVNGDPNKGYWFACVMPEYSEWAVPGQAGSDYLTDTTAVDKNLKQYLTNPPYPCVEFNEENDTLKGQLNDFLTIKKPIHETQAKVLLKQGLEDDKLRGVSSSSAQRESPSHVFGISTPGRSDGAPVDPQSSTPSYRLGGHTFVMDDGDSTGKSQCIRLRSAGGHQILMSDGPDSDSKVLYIGNASGTVWMEFTDDGKVNLYANSDISFRSKSNINFHADSDINMFAYGNTTLFSGSNVKVQADQITSKGITKMALYGGQVEMSSGSTLNLTSATSGGWAVNSQLVLSAGKVYVNEQLAPVVAPPPTIKPTQFPDTVSTAPAPYYKWKNTGKVSSTVPIVPTHEPYLTQHKTVSSTVSPTTVPPVPQQPGPQAAKGTGVGTNIVTQTDISAQPPNAMGVGSLSADETTALKAAIGKVESGNNYSAENQYGYIGKYQFGAQVLQQLGMIIPGLITSYSSLGAQGQKDLLGNPNNWAGEFGISSKQLYFDSHDVQEALMDQLLTSNYNVLLSKQVITTSSPSDDVGGKLMAAHLMGASGCAKWVATGQQASDANGTTITSYYNKGKFAIDTLPPTQVA